MCDYCGCRRSGPTSELAAEHERLLELGDILYTALRDGTDVPDVFAEFVRMLEMHAAKEEVGLFVHAKASTPLADQIDALCREHDDLHRWLADGLTGPHVARRAPAPRHPHRRRGVRPVPAHHPRPRPRAVGRDRTRPPRRRGGLEPTRRHRAHRTGHP